MHERVLIVSGGLVTSTEESVAGVLRKALPQWAGSRAAWLDLKVKLVMAETLWAVRRERRRGTPAELSPFFEDRSNAETPPVTQVLLATLLERAGVAWDTLDVADVFDRSTRTRRKIEAATCVFLSSTYLHDLSELEPIVRRLRGGGRRIVVGGALAGILCHRWRGMPGVDVLAVGYGEALVDPLVRWMRSGYRELEPPDGGRLLRHEHTTFLFSGVPEGRSLDYLPVPDWSLAATPAAGPPRMIYYESVRGCPYRCNFCNYPYLFDDTRFRYRSAEKIADDWARYVGELGVEFITCLDSLFTVPRERLRRLCRLLIRRRTPVKWICYARADDLADEETVAMMREAGAWQVHIGIESGDGRLLENMDKVCSVESNRDALRNCRKHGLTSVISLIVGFPGETEATLQRTYDFLRDSPPDFHFLATFSTRVAGVPLLEPANRRRFGLRTMANLHSMAPYWSHDTMSCAEVGNHVRRLDRRLASDGISVNAIWAYPHLLSYRPEFREPLLELQRRAVTHGPWATAVFDRLNRWVDHGLRRDVRRRLDSVTPEEPLLAASH